MNGIDKITARIVADAQQEAEILLAEAKVEGQEIIERHDRQAQDQYWKLVTAGRREADGKADRMRRMASMEARKQVLGLKQELVEEALDRTVQYFLDLPEDQYVDLLAQFVVRAAKSGREQLIFSPKDRGLYGKKVTIRANEALGAKGMEAELTMSEEAREMSGGVIVTDGLVDVNCSFDAMIEAQKGVLISPVAEILFD